MTSEEATLALVANCPTSRATDGTSLRGELVSDRIHSKNHGALDVHEQCLLAARAKGGRAGCKWMVPEYRVEDYHCDKRFLCVRRSDLVHCCQYVASQVK